MKNLIVAMLIGGSVYFCINWYLALGEHRRMTEIEKRNAQLYEDERRRNKRSPRQRIQDVIDAYGLQVDLTTAWIVMGFLYLVVTVTLSLIGVAGIIGVILGLPATAVVAFGGMRSLANRRRAKFNAQLMQALTLLAGQLEAGNGPTRALEQILPSLQDPLRTEFKNALDATIASKPLVEALGDLAERYPSRAMAMYISALSLEGSGQIAPALRQAASILQKDFELAEEASAELSQTKSETLAVIVIIVGIALTVYGGGDATTRAAYMTPVGFIGVLFGIGNFSLGIYRATRVFAKAKASS